MVYQIGMMKWMISFLFKKLQLKHKNNNNQNKLKNKIENSFYKKVNNLKVHLNQMNKF